MIVTCDTELQNGQNNFLRDFFFTLWDLQKKPNPHDLYPRSSIERPHFLPVPVQTFDINRLIPRSPSDLSKLYCRCNDTRRPQPSDNPLSPNTLMYKTQPPQQLPVCKKTSSSDHYRTSDHRE